MKSHCSFRRQRVLIVGCGDIGLRCGRLLSRRYQCVGLIRDPSRAAALRAAGITPLPGDLDRHRSLARLAALGPAFDHIVHLAPPRPEGEGDARTVALLAALRRPPRRTRTAARPAGVPGVSGGTRRPIVPERTRRLVYASTSGVYGDRRGARTDETARVAPATARARRRVAAERLLRAAAGTAADLSVSVLRVPGIYDETRLPVARLQRGTPALRGEDDVFTNHIHADDLAAIVVRALRRGRPQRIVHASDDSALKMGDYFELVAAHAGLAPPPRVSLAQARENLDPALLSFMLESRRLDNGRLRREFGYALTYPTVGAFFARSAARSASSR
ncbi:NAD-dependent epimerase/dehydratase family protein [Chitinasiproducens palmae]|uniref:Nucleoside-diphosphate-sugar epimerase n=1 Tax=Chitinasiproducens palmae TaxID=1770053 RepID=A0A1H2PS36_9BURK|nr:NAD-dependent epimerase/dehydratase family protein [Chitinasiproducens palmae]SDV49357.1 Nucleoside-diphosphate-sugar epimerase [Chitinasiproducens palmae]